MSSPQTKSPDYEVMLTDIPCSEGIVETGAALSVKVFWLVKLPPEKKGHLAMYNNIR